MASLIRGKQAGIQNDFSAGLTPDLFALDDASSHMLVASGGLV